jgi:hypothetical protein
MGPAAIIALIYIVITMACVAMSAWSTYHGYESMFREITILVTIVICAGLLACDIAILSWRRHGRSVVGIVLLLLMFTIFSAASNYNFFYTNFQRDRFAAQRIEEAKRVFDDNMSLAETTLNHELRKSGRRQGIEGALQNLRNEVQDPSNRGFGPRAKELLAKLHEALKPNDFQEPSGVAPGQTYKRNQEVLEVIERRVQEKLDTDENHAPVLDGLAAIKELRDKQTRAFKALPSTPTLLSSDYYKARIGAIKSLGEDTSEISRRITQILASRGKSEQISLKSVSDAGIELNEILVSARSGLQPENQPIAAALATLAVLIDIIPLLFAMVFVNATVADQEAAGEPSRFKEEDALVVLGNGKQ